jgi:hypothetical protein
MAGAACQEDGERGDDEGHERRKAQQRFHRIPLWELAHGGASDGYAEQTLQAEPHIVLMRV